MLKGKLNGRLGVGKGRRPKRRDRAAIRFATLESLDQRIMPVVTATFSRAAGVLKITGDARHNQFEVSLTPAGRLRVNNGAVKIAGGRATLARTNLIRVVGRAGNDVISLNETNGALPRARLWGGAGNDVITGGSGDDQLLGQKGNDDLFGKAGSDELRGGAGDDDLTGGDDDDQAFGEAGNDRMIWNPGEDTDLNEGGEGSDVVEVNGGNGNETFTVTPNGARVRFDRTNPAPFSLDIGTSESLVVNVNGGDDVVTASTGLAALIQLTADGGAGNDTLNGSDGADVLIGGDGDDFIDGNRGDDTASLGLGNDTFQWDPGDGSDVVEGQAGTDTLQFNGANANEQIDISANGQRTRFFRDVATITMDLDDVERINFEALGGTDTVTVNDLTGTDVTEVNVNLAGTLGGNAGDGLADAVIVNGTNGADAITVDGTGSDVNVSGLAAVVKITRSEGANDQLTINGLAGADTINASGLAADAIKLTIDAGADNDNVQGSNGADVLVGGDGDDFIDGNRGDDTASLGLGNDTFQWDPGDGSDVVEGQAGTDTLQFNGANANEQIDISANGQRTRFFRDVATITMDLDDVERINFEALGGTDTVTVNDLTGTDVTEVNVNLAGTLGGNAGDGLADAVIVNGTNGADNINVAGNASAVAVSGLTAQVNIALGESANDRLTVNALGGDDTVNAAGLSADAIRLTEDGGEGDDDLTGGSGDDTLLGGPGVDVLDGGPGNDVEVQD